MGAMVSIAPIVSIVSIVSIVAIASIAPMAAIVPTLKKNQKKWQKLLVIDKKVLPLHRKQKRSIAQLV